MRYENWQNLPDMFFEMARDRDRRPFLWAKTGDEGKRRYRPVSWAEAARQVNALSRGLRALGVDAGDRVLVCAENRPEWVVADLAVMAAGAVTVAADAKAPPATLRHLLEDSGARVAIASTAQISARLLQAADGLETLTYLVAMAPPTSGASTKVTLVGWQDVLGIGEEQPDDCAARLAAVGREDVACLIYTSGTSGPPKGVMLSHGAILANCAAAHAILEKFGVSDEVFLSVLPLSHAYEHTLGLFFPISIGAQIYYAESADRVGANLREARPTIMTSVPRLLEALRQRIAAHWLHAGRLSREMFRHAVELGRRRHEPGQRLGWRDRLVDLALDRVVRRRVRARFGGRLKVMVSGGAPLSYDTGLFFTALGLTVLQGYGQTEAAPLITCNPHPTSGHGVRLDTVGPPCRGVEIRIAPDGEILARGDSIMTGYWGREQATAEALADGWLHTGDIGAQDADGYLRITGRKKDVIVTSGGGIVSPKHVEDTLTRQPAIDQAVVCGDSKSHLMAVLVPAGSVVQDVTGDGDGARPSLAEIADDPGLRQALAAAVAAANQNLAPAEQVRQFVVAREPFTVDNGLVTATFEPRRQAVIDRYREALEARREKQ